MRVGGITIDQTHFAGASFITTAISSASKLALGLITGSSLVLLNGIYLLVLILPRAFSFLGRLVHDRLGTKTDEEAADIMAPPQKTVRRERQVQIGTAASLIALGITFSFLSDHVQGGSFGFSTIPAITFATMAFAKLGVAIWGLVKLRGNHQADILSCKLTSLADGMASIVLTQIALRQIGAGGQADSFDRTFGILIGIAIVAMGFRYLVYLLKERKAGEVT